MMMFAAPEASRGFVIVYTTEDDNRVRLWTTIVFESAAQAAELVAATLKQFSPTFYQMQVVALCPFRMSVDSAGDPTGQAERDELAEVRERLRGNAFGQVNG